MSTTAFVLDDGALCQRLRIQHAHSLRCVALDADVYGRNAYKGGAGRITGTVMERAKGAPQGSQRPVVRRVCLLCERTRACVAETWSDERGLYTFHGLDPSRRYSALAYDHTGRFCAEVASALEAVQ